MLSVVEMEGEAVLAQEAIAVATEERVASQAGEAGAVAPVMAQVEMGVKAKLGFGRSR